MIRKSHGQYVLPLSRVGVPRFVLADAFEVLGLQLPEHFVRPRRRRR